MKYRTDEMRLNYGSRDAVSIIPVLDNFNEEEISKICG